GPIRLDSLRVDVGCPVPVVSPRDDGRSRAVGDNGGVVLVVGSGANGAAVHWPGRIHDTGGQYVLGVDVLVRNIVAVVSPRDDGAPRTIRDDRRIVLVL